MSQFNVGDRVEYGTTGRLATIIQTPAESKFLLIEFDEPFPSGHDGDGIGKPGHCWFCWEDGVTLIQDKTAQISDDWESLFGSQNFN